MERVVVKCEARSPALAPLVDELFAKGRIARWRFRRLWRHLEGCATCRGYYDRVALVWRAMGPGAEPPQVAEMRAQAAVEQVLAGAGRRPSRALAWSLLATSAAAALVLVVVLRPGRDGTGGAWTERGGAGVADGRDRGVRAFCIGRSDRGEPVIRGEVASSAMGSAAATPLHCRRGDELQFAYSLGAGAAEYLVLAGRDEGGTVHPYQPAQLDREGAVALRAGVTGEPLPGSVRLGVNHHAGTVTVEALFTTGPLPAGHALALRDGDSQLVARQRLRLIIEP